MVRRPVAVAALAALAAALAPAAASADLASLKAACAPSEGVRFCDDGVPDAGGRTPNPGGVKAIEVPAAYAGHRGLPAADPVAAATVPGNSAGKVALDADLTLPTTPPPPGGYPLVVFMHGCCAGNKTDWEGTRIDGAGEQWHHNNRWFALRGYAVLTYTARGFVTTTASGEKGSTGEAQLDHRAFEINDFQHLAGQLADDPDLQVNGQRVIPAGGSYGGGFGWLALTDPRWRSPGGREMRLAAVLTRYGWTDLVYSLAPTGAHLPGRLPAFDGADSLQPPGIVKRSFNTVLFQSGATGTPGPAGSRHTTFPPAIAQTLACLMATDPSQQPPACAAAQQTVRSFLEDRSAYYQNEFFADLAADPALATPVFVAGTFSDQLFTSIETLRMVDRLRSVVPQYPVQQYFGDYQHATQNKAREWADVCGADRHPCSPQDGSTPDSNEEPVGLVATGVNTRMNRFLDHYATPRANPEAPAPAFDVTASLYVCRTNASDQRPLEMPGERFTADTFAALAPNELAVAFDRAQRTVSTVPRNDHATQADPVVNAVSNGGSCPNATTAPPEGTAAWQTEPLDEAATMIGLGRVTYRYSATTTDPATLQLNTRLYDVAPDGRATMVDRGVRRLPAATGEVTYALHGQAWRFERGHAIRIEATQDDDPYVRRSTTPSSIDVARAELRLPVRERGVAVRPGAPVQTARSRRCRPPALERARARPAGRGLRFAIPRGRGRVVVSVFRHSRGRRVAGPVLVARFARRGSFRWRGRANRRGRRVTDGVYQVRLQRGRAASRLAVERRGGRFRRRPDYALNPGCGVVRLLRLTRPVLGGRRGHGVRITFRLGARGDATVRVMRGRRTLRTMRRPGVRAGRRVVLRLRPGGLPRGTVRVVLRVRSGGRTVTRSVAARRV
ncbi:MAG TPA: CocE/NonD family hydrolase C-terminal non-catalytic domain-containing protein [Solirubrobacteraceae bacterium]|nr:CocE/NonD family hydrolase C-terminal non-catalytic domain-containing protein [Solirubrobacteraceae bacterium]